ncbi:MAG TPA: hypothetical protein EYG86_06220 [Crocinitomicaceae bacterium]|nr:hypothetical protein [Crocinitomicaceae bacterium]
MKKTTQQIFTVLIFCFGIMTVSYSQISKSEAEKFISDHPAKDVQRVSVITFMEYKKKTLVRNGDSFEAKSTVLTALESSLLIKDGTGKEMYIPYSQIRTLTYQPESSAKYSMIRVDL